MLIAYLDIIEPSNLNQRRFSVEQISQTKVETLRGTSGRTDPYAEVGVRQARLAGANIHIYSTT